jgi:hypothetical protein
MSARTKKERTWNSPNADTDLIKKFAAHREKAGLPVVLTFLLANGKTYNGILIEAGTYCYTVQLKLGDNAVKAVLNKSQLIAVLMPE